MTDVVATMDGGGLDFALFVTFLIVYGCILLWGAVMCVVFAISLFRGRKVLIQVSFEKTIIPINDKIQWPFFRIVKNLTILDGFFIFSQVGA